MKGKLLGIGPRRTGTGQNTGKKFDMTSFYFIVVSPHDVTGDKTEEVIFNHKSSLVLPDVHIGDILQVSHNKSGYLDEFEIIEKAGKSPPSGNVKLGN